MISKFLILFTFSMTACDPESGFLNSSSKISKRGEIAERSNGDIKVVSDIAISGPGESRQADRVILELLYNDKYSNRQKEEAVIEWEVKKKPNEAAFVQRMVSDKDEAIYYFDDEGEFVIEAIVKIAETEVRAEHKITVKPFIVEKPNVAPTIQLTGSTRAIVAGETVSLAARIEDDNFEKLPPLTFGWTVESGDKEAITFSNSNELETEITVAAPGEYRLRVTADDHQFKEFKEFSFTAYSKRISPEDGYVVSTTFTRSNNDSWSCGLDSKGVFCFGSRAPAVPANIVKPIELVMGDNHACIIDRNSLENPATAAASVKCWGATSPSTVPDDLGEIKDIDAGMQNTCAIHTIEIDDVSKPIFETDGDGNIVVDGEGNPVQATGPNGDLLFEPKDFDDLRCWGATTMNQFTTAFRTAISAATVKKHIVVGNTSQVCFVDETTHKIACNTSPVANGVYSLQADEEVEKLTLGYASVCAIIVNAQESKKAECWGDTGFSLASAPLDKGEPIDIATGQYFNCGVFKLGDQNSLECWGQDIYSTRNTQPSSLAGPVQVSVAIDRACVIDSFSAQCWGQDRNGSNGVPVTADFGVMDIGANEQLRRTLFKDVIKANFSRNCGNGGCHTNDSWSFDYFAAKSIADKILDRMDRPNGDPLRMPRGRNWASAQDELDVREWLSLIMD